MFVTAFDHRAVEAFEVNAVDYLLKPVEAARLADPDAQIALGGIVYAKLLPADRSVRILGMPNRLTMALGMSLLRQVLRYLYAGLGALLFLGWRGQQSSMQPWTRPPRWVPS